LFSENDFTEDYPLFTLKISLLIRNLNFILFIINSNIYNPKTSRQKLIKKLLICTADGNRFCWKNKSDRCVRPRLAVYFYWIQITWNELLWIRKPPGTFYSFVWKTYQASFKMSVVLCRYNILPEIMHEGAPEVLAPSKANVQSESLKRNHKKQSLPRTCRTTVNLERS
jgi:hypothetical protein